MKVVFENRGVIDPRTIKTFGVSVKENENPIGYFGTGLKYAIAILLRTGHSVVIWAGMERFEFAAKSVTIRNQDFQVVTMNGEELGFTTDVGKNWKMWMAYRELYCNAMDEGGTAWSGPDAGMSDPSPDTTLVIIGGDEFLRAHHDRGQYFLEGTPLFAGTEAEVYNGASKGIFYRGVKVCDTPMGDSIYTYNVTRPIQITEDRTVAYVHQIYQAVGKTITESLDSAWIRKVITAGHDTFEGKIDLESWAGDSPSPMFLQVVEKAVQEKIADVSMSAVRHFQKHTARTALPAAVTMTSIQRQRLERCVSFAKLIGYEVDRYPIKVVDRLGSGTLAIALDDAIWITREVFETSNLLLAHALIEEFMHLDTGYGDMTRDLQSALFRKIVSMGEEHVLKETL